LQVGAQRIASLRMGQGPGPTVVLQSGLGDGLQVWSDLVPRLTDRHPVFSIDRPGYGDSPRAFGPRDPCTQARELRASLQAAGVAPPYLLVGHSIGGLYQHAFARLYPQEVAGLLLIEPTHPQHWASMQREVPAIATLVRGMRSAAFTATMRDEFDAQTSCLDTLPPSPASPPPALLLRRSDWPAMEQGAFAEMASRLWEDWRRLAAVQRVERLPGSDHYLQRSQPDAVAAAIKGLVARHCPQLLSDADGRRCQPPR
jgi:pimeloyl-ACP methyl ester carboxylesterase